MMTPIYRFKLLCVNITVLTGIGVDLDSDCHNRSQLLSKVTAHLLNPGVKGHGPSSTGFVKIEAGGDENSFKWPKVENLSSSVYKLFHTYITQKPFYSVNEH